MRAPRCTLLLAVLLVGNPARAGNLAPGFTFRAVYPGSKPAQAMRDPAAHQLRGPAFQLATALAQWHDLMLEFRAVDDSPTVIEAVRSGTADLGFVTYEATRFDTVEFSQIHMLVEQSFLVLDGSPIRDIAGIDHPGSTVANIRNNSVTLCMKCTLHRAHLMELFNDPTQLGQAIITGAVAAFGANRQRLTALARVTPGTRLLPGNLFSVLQNMVVPRNRPPSSSSTP